MAHYHAEYSRAKDYRFSLWFCLSEECSRGLALRNENDACACYSSFFIRLLLFFILSLHHQIINVVRIELIGNLFILLILVLLDRLLLSLLYNSAFLLFFLSLFLNRLSHLYFYYLLFNLLLLLLLLMLLVLLVVNRGCFFNIFFYNLFDLWFVFIVFTVLVFFLVLYDDVDATLSTVDDFATQVNLFFLLKF